MTQPSSAQHRQLLISFPRGISMGNVFLLPPTTAVNWCCIADGLVLTVPNMALYSGEMPVNPAKEGRYNSVYDEQDFL